MISRLRNAATFHLERALVRGAVPRLLVIAILIALVSVAAGIVVYLATPGFKTLADAIWWAFLRLSDPGYLGDDQGALKRTVSTVVTVAGYVLFMGSLIAIMTQWLMQTLRNLERGLTPIVAHDHVVVLGSSNRTATVLQELLGSQGRVRRFLRRRGARRLRVAVLAEEVNPELVADLKAGLGALWNRRQIILRSGDSLRLEHLRRVDVAHASAILVPGSQDAGEAVDADTRVIKTLLTIASDVDLTEDEAPLVVAEIHDSREIPAAKRLYKGPTEIIAGGQLVGRLIAQTIRNPGLSHVFGELLQHDENNEIYLRPPDRLVGATMPQLFDAFPHAVPIGLIRQGEQGWVPHLGLGHTLTCEASDRIVIIARNYDDAGVTRSMGDPFRASTSDNAPSAERPSRRVLLLGWNQRVPALLAELDRYGEQFTVKVASLAPRKQREELLEGYDFLGERVTVEHVELDGTNLSHLRRLEPASYDNVVLMASARADTEAASDARTILAYLLLRETITAKEAGPKVVVELVDPANAELFQTRAGEVIVSPLVVSHMLAQVALRRELRVVFDDLFGATGPQIVFRPVSQYGLAARTSFTEIQQAAVKAGELALGVRFPRGRVKINPPHDEMLELAENDELLVIAR